MGAPAPHPMEDGAHTYHPVDVQKSSFFNAHPGPPQTSPGPPRVPPGPPRDLPGSPRDLHGPPRYPHGDPPGPPKDPPGNHPRIPRALGDLSGTPKEPSKTSPSTPIVWTVCLDNRLITWLVSGAPRRHLESVWGVRRAQGSSRRHRPKAFQ